MYRNIVYNNRSRDITLWTWDENGERVERRIPFKPHIYFEHKGGKDAISIFKTPLKKREFETEFDRRKFVQTAGMTRLFNNLPPEQQFLIEYYGDLPDQSQFVENALRVFFLDIEVFSPDEFPKAEDAKHPVNLITIYDTLVGKYLSWGLGSYNNTRSDVIYKHCSSEGDLFRKFMAYWTKNYPDIMTGWNCLNLNEHIWLQDRIVKMSKVSKNTLLSTSELVSDYKETGMKAEYRMVTALGNEIYSSIDHKFPVYCKDKHSYKNINSLSKTVKDMTLNEILNNTEDMYLRVEKRVNNNTPMTFRMLLMDYYSDIFRSEFELIIDNVDVKNIIKTIGLCDDLRPEYSQGTTFWKRCPSFWSSKNISKIYPEFNILEYINNATHLMLKRNNGYIFKLELDVEISKDMFRLLGFIFTDGGIPNSNINNSEYKFSSKYLDLAQYYTDIISNITGKKYTKPFMGNADGNFYKTVNINNIIGVLHSLIYDSNDQKQLNIEILSRLSHEQFVGLWNGLIDGDGFIDPNGVNLCNFDSGYQDNLHGLQELLLWNNIQSSVHKNVLRISASKFNKPFIDKLDIKHIPRKIKIDNLIFKEKYNRSSKHIKFFESDDYMLVRIDRVESTGKEVLMADMETPSHYFTCNGIKTHNCDGFDIPYIVNRMERLFGSKYANQLSPTGRIWSTEKLDRFMNPVTEWVIQGVSCIDYMKAYKKFSRNERESYTLDYIGELEVGVGKIDFDGSLAELSQSDWQKYVNYNIRDVELMVKLEQELHFLELCRMIAYKGLTKFEKALATNNVVAGAFALQARKANLIIPTFQYEKGGRPPGGLVRFPENGFSDDVVSFDAKSLYPNTIITMNLSPETKIGQCTQDDNFTFVTTVRGKQFKLKNSEFNAWMVKNNVCKSIHGTLFSQNVKGIIPSIIEGIYSDRIASQKKRNKYKRDLSKLDGSDHSTQKHLEKRIQEEDTLQYTLKILMNSIYGTFGNHHSCLYDLDMAASITLTGQESNLQASLAVQKFIKKKYNCDENLLVYGDTDSIYITLRPLFDHLGIKLLESEERIEGKPMAVTKEAMDIITELGGEGNPADGAITKHLEHWAKTELNSIDSRFMFAREKISKRGIFLEAKKRYVVQVVDNEGIPVPVGSKKEFSYTGIEVVSSTYAKEVQNMMKEMIQTMIISNDMGVSNLAVVDAYDQFCKLPPVVLATRKSVKDLKKYAPNSNGFQIGKGTPQNSKASLLYNNMIDHLTLGKEYEKIKSGDKIKILYIAKNRFGLEYIGFKDIFPPEFGLAPDYRKLYLKHVHPVMERMFQAVSWTITDPTKNYECDLFSEFG